MQKHQDKKSVAVNSTERFFAASLPLLRNKNNEKYLLASL